MKRLYITSFLFTVCLTNAYSQLQVDSIGYVGVGVTDEILEYDDADSIMSPFSVYTAGIEEAISSFQSTDRQYSITAYTARTGYSNGTGIWSVSTTRKGNSEGIVGVGIATGYNATNSVIGVRGEVDGINNSVGVYGGCYFLNGTNDFAGIYGTTTSGYPNFQYSGVYAGYFNGSLLATGPIYAQSFSTVFPSSSKSNKGNTSFNTISEKESVSDKFKNISTLEFHHNEDATLTKQTNPVEEFLKGRDIQQLTKKELHQLDSICMNSVPEETDPLAYVNYGLDAEQLKAMFPKLVQQDKDGNYRINYIEMIPLLVKSINELSEELAELKGTSRNKVKALSETTAIDNNITDIDMVRMDQNKPNPFSESTVIGLNIPVKTLKANIFIYDLSGKQVKNIQVGERGETNITVYAGELGSGMYIYTLVVDGKVAVTRRMIVE